MNKRFIIQITLNENIRYKAIDCLTSDINKAVHFTEEEKNQYFSETTLPHKILSTIELEEF